MIKNHKPIRLDINLEYRCPNSNCDIIHWLTFNEVKTKNFKVVCDCGQVFMPQRIIKVKPIYKKKQIKSNITTSTTIPEDTNQESTIINDSISELEKYGFTHDEAIDLINKSYKKTPTNSITTLIKNALLEINNG